MLFFLGNQFSVTLVRSKQSDWQEMTLLYVTSVLGAYLDGSKFGLSFLVVGRSLLFSKSSKVQKWPVEEERAGLARHPQVD